MSLELTLLVWSVPLLFLHICVQAGLLSRDLGGAYNAGPRDEERELSPIAGRAARALRNFLETWPAFIVLALVVEMSGATGWLTQWGAAIYFLARIAYIPLYLGGVRYVRSVAFTIACAGLLMMFFGIVV